MDQDRPNVQALVLTFNAPEHLVACLKGIQRQTVKPHGILVIDNASRTPARHVLSESRLVTDTTEFLRLPENLGPAGGYAAGFRRFLASGFDAVWVIDDDCVPHPACLTALLDQYSSSEQKALIFPTVRDSRGRPSNYPAWHGVLIPRTVVEAVGVPKEEFFWWAEDSEYLQWRIPRAGFEVVRISERPGETVTHYWAHPRKRAAWKYYYEIRNHVYLIVHIQRRTSLRRVFVPVIRTILRILLIEDRRLLKLRLFFRGCRDGFAGRLGRTIRVGSRDEPVHPLADPGPV